MRGATGIRRQLDIGPGCEVEVAVVGDAVELRKATGNADRGERVEVQLRAAPYAGPSTEELLALTRYRADPAP